ncbi:helix-turn-helix domain-containing protein, partial [Bacillus velezensis]|uniref:helix-turn-helix domain-containing protein n=1 Tax=Bacillus velezensis TaxID=492670 RepID=UPI00119D918F
EQKNKIVRGEELIRSVWNDEGLVSDNTLRVNVKGVGKKLDELGMGKMIERKVGQG